ncbi:MAG: hypothetical protein NT091_04940, partial [Candidatus Falkowbacteria bacterium]|nr:hypothetical protein [Candidatus Falkowbacteria bacterium]
SLLLAAPVYYFSLASINKSLFLGGLSKDAAVRRWLTYLIIFICGSVVVGWLIAIIYSFLDGDLTLKFSLKTLTVLIISSIVGYYYYRDIKKENFEGVIDPVVKKYFYSTLVLVIVIVISGLIFVESPFETRLRKLDTLITQKIINIDSALNNYYNDNSKVPAILQDLIGETVYLQEPDIKDPLTEKVFEYTFLDNKKYKICADFNLSNKNDKNEDAQEFYDKTWVHDTGHFCFTKKIQDRKDIPAIDALNKIPMEAVPANGPIEPMPVKK